MSTTEPDDNTPASMTGSTQRGNQMAKYEELKNLTVESVTGTTFAYRDTGGDGVPLVLLQHFRGTLDSWDPDLLDDLGSNRRVIAFDNVGVGGSSGNVPHTIAEMASGALEFLDAIALEKVDLLGFSIGSFVAQELAITRPSLINRVVLASAAPKGAPGMHRWAPDVIAVVGVRETGPEAYLNVFFTPSEESQNAGKAFMSRIFSRSENKDAPATWECRVAQYDAVCEWGEPNRALLERLESIEMPVFVANGDSDPMILPRYSYLLAGLLPDVRVKIYPDSAHGFLFQHHEEFASDVEAFLCS